jgi:TrmH family RNA methyltransferase
MITSRRNETLKAIRRLRRRQGDAVLLEGPHLLEEALASNLVVSTVLVTSDFMQRVATSELLTRLRRAPLVVEPAILDELCDADSPRGVLAVAELPRPRGASAILPGEGIVLLVDAVQEPGNLGAIARVAEAFGVRALALTGGTVHPNHPRALRASAGSLLRVPVVRDVAPAELHRQLAASRALWAALVAHGGSSLPHALSSSSIVLCCGSEGAGLSPETAQQVEAHWTIPLQGRAESLNVAVAAGVALYALRRATENLPA